jgi:hypothetical protein
MPILGRGTGEHGDMEQGDLPMLVFSDEDIDICRQTILL